MFYYVWPIIRLELGAARVGTGELSFSFLRIGEDESASSFIHFQVGIKFDFFIRPTCALVPPTHLLRRSFWGGRPAPPLDPNTYSSVWKRC